MDFSFEFVSDEQAQAFNATQKYQCLSGGYGSGKTYIALLKLITLALTFDGYRVAVVRKELKVLKQTTMKTFLKIVPEHLIKNASVTEGTFTLYNGSEFIFLGLDRFDEQNVKSLELNAAFLDQAEEIDELIYTHLDTRLGRWDKVKVPAAFLDSDLNWPRNPHTKAPLAPIYFILACNPDTEFHWIYQYFHPKSDYWERNHKYTHFFVNMPSTSNTALSEEVLRTMVGKDQEFVRRYVMGEWGFSEAQVHRIPKESIIEPSNEFISNLLKKAMLYRTYDHGEKSPSCCLWGASFQGIHFIYREYYEAGKLVSYHRYAISQLSGNEEYVGSFADPEIFKKKAQKNGARYCTADEYTDPDLVNEGLITPQIFWSPADNDELGTRNRINELFELDPTVKHPITGQFGAPKIYFIKKNKDYINGCDHVIQQTSAQRREKLGELQGKTVWSQNRDENVADHAYDPFRYYVAIHSRHSTVERRQVPKRSFKGLEMERERSLLNGIRSF